MNRIKELRKNFGIKQIDLANQLEVSQASLSGWENGKYEPDTNSWAKLAEIFNVSVDYLMGRTLLPRSVSETEEMTFDDFSYALYGEVRELNDEEKETLLNMAKFLRQQREKGKET